MRWDCKIRYSWLWKILRSYFAFAVLVSKRHALCQLALNFVPSTRYIAVRQFPHAVQVWTHSKVDRNGTFVATIFRWNIRQNQGEVLP